MHNFEARWPPAPRRPTPGMGGILDEVAFFSWVQFLESDSRDSPQLPTFPATGGMSISGLKQEVWAAQHTSFTVIEVIPSISTGMKEHNVLEMVEMKSQYLTIRGNVETGNYYCTGPGRGWGHQGAYAKFRETFTLKGMPVKNFALKLPWGQAPPYM